MHIDAHFEQGSTHTSCHDYAVCTGRTAVVSDGCSSAQHSDVGARLVAHAAIRAEPGSLLDTSWIEAADRSRRTLALPVQCLDATCIIAQAEDDAVLVTMHGDGVVAARHDDGSLAVIDVRYPDDAPPYPSYALSEVRQAAYDDAGLGIPCIHATVTAPVHQMHGRTLHWRFERSQWSSVLIGSDGLSAVRGAGASCVPTRSVVDVLFRYPSQHGAFVVRRLRRFVQREAPATGLSPLDDVAIAALCWEQR